MSLRVNLTIDITPYNSNSDNVTLLIDMLDWFSWLFLVFLYPTVVVSVTIVPFVLVVVCIWLLVLHQRLSHAN